MQKFTVDTLKMKTPTETIPFKPDTGERADKRLKTAMENALHYYHTAKHLRFNQLRRFFVARVAPPKLEVSSENSLSEAKPIPLRPCLSRNESYLGNGSFLFLSRRSDLGMPIDWRARSESVLWRYNLHYFDYLHQRGLDPKTGRALMRSWIEGNPVDRNLEGWQPYTLSLRLINWMKFFSLKMISPPSDLLKSMMLQAINLKKQIEYHLQGNHLMTNGKALWFSGVFLNEDEFLNIGRDIFMKELPKQFLSDGGHFELSPMYHALALEDILDVFNLCRAENRSEDRNALTALEGYARKALGWLGAVVDENGDIPLLNDAAHGIAPRYEALKKYARSLGVEENREHIERCAIGSWSEENLSGYRNLKHGPFRLLFDTAVFGPDYIPGHAHCDMLSLLFDFDGRNIFTDSGVYEYAEGERRNYCRGTTAHNTVVIDGLDQAELWKSFRVGRRGRPDGFGRKSKKTWCSHTGFSIHRRKLNHKREITLFDRGFQIMDSVCGPQTHRFESFFHFAPGLKIEKRPDGTTIVEDRLVLKPWGAEVERRKSDYFPEFGRAENRDCLVLHGSFNRNARFGLQCIFCS